MKMTLKTNSTSKMKTVPGPSLYNLSFACFPPFDFVINKTKTWNLKGRDEMFSYKCVSGQIIRFCLTPSHGIIPNIKVKKEKFPANDKKCPSCQDIHFLHQSLQTESGKEGDYVGTWEQVVNKPWMSHEKYWTVNEQVMNMSWTSREQVKSK